MKNPDNYFSSENIDSVFNKVAAETIKSYREKSGLSLEDVVKKMNNSISRQMLFKYENNLARMKNKVFIDICKALNQDGNKIWHEINTKALNESLDLIAEKNGDSPEDRALYDYRYRTQNEEKNTPPDELDILFDKNKDILTEADKNIMKTIIMERRKQIDKELRENEEA